MLKTATFKIKGMHCASCANHIEKDLKNLAGVEKVSVNFATEKAKIGYDMHKLSDTDIIEQVKKTGYTAIPEDHSAHHDHAAMEDRAEINGKLYKVLFGIVAGILVVYLRFFSDFPNKGMLILLITFTVIIYTSRDFFIRGIPDLVPKFRPGMDTLVALGIGTAFVYSSYNVIFTFNTETYFLDAVIISTFIMLGRYLEAKAKGSANAAIKKLLELSAKVAHKVISANKTVDIPIEEVQKGDLLLVKPGEKIPTDGIITHGEATIDESMVTGESMPVDKRISDKIIGATINGNVVFTMKAEKVGSETMLAQMIKLVEEAQMNKAPIQKLVDIISNYFVWGVILIATGTFFICYFTGHGISQSVIHTVAVLVVACPCALGLATPISIVVGSGRGASLGILMKKPSSLEKMHKITTICFDKTGTITAGKPQVTDFIPYIVPQNVHEKFALDGINPSQKENYIKILIQYAASLEYQSEHPLASAVLAYAQKAKAEFLQVSAVKAVTGKGIKGKIKNKSVLIGNRQFFADEKIMRCAELDQQAEKLFQQGKTVLFLAIDGKERALLALQDEAKKTSFEAIKLLHKKHIKTVMMTGDNQAVAEAIAKKVGIDEVFAAITPEGKTAKIKELRATGEFVAMVGDGINDAPALAAADIGIAMGTGTDVAIESGDIVLVKGDLLKAVTAIDLSASTYLNIKQNLFWAFFYNTIGIPLAAFGLLNPMFSAAAMAFSSISVVLNALRLKILKLK